MARFERDVAFPRAAQRTEERTCHVRVEAKARRQLDEVACELVTERRRFREEAGQRAFAFHEAAIVRDRLRQLGAEAERRWRAGGPALPDERLVRPMERRIDFSGGKLRGVALQVRTL